MITLNKGINMKKKINKLDKSIIHKMALLVLFFVIIIPVSKADYSEIYNDEALFEKGRKAYNENKHKDAASFLFAYIQRKPSQMETKPTHRRQVLNAVEFALEGADLPAGTIGMVRPPVLEKIKHHSNALDKRLGHKLLDFNGMSSIQGQATQIYSFQSGQIKLLNLLKTRHWKQASKLTSELIVDQGDKNGDGWLSYYENDTFPCPNLKTLSRLWKKHYGSSTGFGDILIPRFHKRFVSCKIWLS